MTHIKLSASAAVFFLATVSSSYAAFPTTIQDLTESPGTGVAISGEWGLVGDSTSKCIVDIYRFDYVTGLWGNGGSPSTAGTPFQTIGGQGGCNAQPSKSYGATLSITDDLLVVGAPEAKISAGGDKELGAIYIYAFDGTTSLWVLKHLSDEPDQQEYARYGSSVSIRKDELTGEYAIIIGAPGYDTASPDPDNIDAGKVYFHQWDGTDLTTLGTHIGSNAGDNFGFSVTSNGVLGVIGAPGYDSTGLSNDGAVYVYDLDNNLASIQTISALTSGADNDNLGTEVSLGDTFLMVAGEKSYTLKDQGVGASPRFVEDHQISGAGKGDVSQSAGMQAYGVTGVKVEVFTQPAADNLIPLDIIEPSGNTTTFGEDISLSNNRLMVNGETQDQAYAYTLPCGVSVDTLEPMVWKMVSIPCAPPASGSYTVDDVFSGLGIYGTDYVVAEQNRTEWSGATVSNVRLVATSEVFQDRSYWVISRLGGSWNVSDGTATVISTAESTAEVAGYYSNINIPLGTDDVSVRPGGPVSVMVANPFPQSFNLSNIIVWVDDNNGSNVWANFGSGGLAIDWGSTVYVYDLGSTIASGQNYRAVTAGTPGMDGQIQAYEGFWMQLAAGAVPAGGLPENIMALPLEK